MRRIPFCSFFSLSVRAPQPPEIHHCKVHASTLLTASECWCACKLLTIQSIQFFPLCSRTSVFPLTCHSKSNQYIDRSVFEGLDRGLIASSLADKVKAFLRAVSLEAALEEMVSAESGRLNSRAISTERDLARCGQA